MPKENTHLFFAHSLEKCLDADNQVFITQHRLAYLAGSYAPDIFYYHPKAQKISKALHGNGPLAAYRVLIRLIENSAEQKNAECFAFALGFLTHYVMDTELHPLVDFRTRHPDPRETMRRHIVLETALDFALTDNHDYCFTMKERDEIRAKAFWTMYAEILGIKTNIAVMAFRNNSLMNVLSRNRFAWNLACLFRAWIDPYDRLFYDHPEAQTMDRQTTSEFRDLMTPAKSRAETCLDLACAVYRQKSPMSEFVEQLPAKTLENGQPITL